MIDDKILAKVNGREITQKNVNSLLESLGQQRAMQFNSNEGRKKLLEELINQELLYLEAIENGLDKEEDFKLQLQPVKEQLLKQYAVGKLLSNVTVDDEEVVNFYNEYKEQLKAPESVKASHILVEDKQKAEEILNEINNGLSFAEAAKKYSKCPSNANGGDLGYFTRGKMVPEFENAAFEMKKGELSRPVQTQFGYHIIKLDDKKESGISKLEDIQQQLKGQMIALKQNAIYSQKSDELRNKYKVEYV